MWRLIGFVIILGFFLVFIGLNLENRCDIRYWFSSDRVVKDVPVYLTAFSAFVLGILFTLPVTLTMRFKGRKNKKTREEPGPKKALFGKTKEAPPSSPARDGEFHGENGPYGVG